MKTSNERLDDLMALLTKLQVDGAVNGLAALEIDSAIKGLHEQHVLEKRQLIFDATPGIPINTSAIQERLAKLDTLMKDFSALVLMKSGLILPRLEWIKLIKEMLNASKYEERLQQKVAELHKSRSDMQGEINKLTVQNKRCVTFDQLLEILNCATFRRVGVSPAEFSPVHALDKIKELIRENPVLPLYEFNHTKTTTPSNHVNLPDRYKEELTLLDNEIKILMRAYPNAGWFLFHQALETMISGQPFPSKPGEQKQ
jgi:hypothetical protein